MKAARARAVSIALLLGWVGLSASCTLLGNRDPEYRYTPSDLDAEALEARLARAGTLFSEPRSPERVLEALEICEQTISPRNGYAALRLAARACVWLAEHHPEEDERLRYARLGVAISAESIRRMPARPGPHYFYALSLGHLSRLEGAGLGRLPRMEANAKKVVEIDPEFEYAGGHRFLGILYFETRDNFLAALGTIDDAIEHLRAACELAPDYGHNHLALARVWLEDEEEDRARRSLEQVLLCPRPPDRSEEHAEWIREARALLAAIDGPAAGPR